MATRISLGDAQKAIDQGDELAALTILKQVVQNNPNAPDKLVTFQLLTGMTKSNPDNCEAWYLLAHEIFPITPERRARCLERASECFSEQKQQSRNKAQPRLRINTETNKQRRTRWVFPFSLTWKAIVAISVIATLISTWYTISPKISASVASTTDPSKPFATMFTISNDTVLPIYDIRFACYYFFVQDSALNTWVNSSGMSPNYIYKIEPLEKASVPCTFPIVLDTKIMVADVAILMSYRPEPLPWFEEKAFRFVTKQASDGTLQWFPQPIQIRKARASSKLLPDLKAFTLATDKNRCYLVTYLSPSFDPIIEPCPDNQLGSLYSAFSSTYLFQVAVSLNPPFY